MSDIKNLKGYLEENKRVINTLNLKQIQNVIGILMNAYEGERQIFIIGNGGSASTASHFANDLSKFCGMGRRKKFRAISLTDNISTITAWANDEGYEQVFSQQLACLANSGDVLVAISASGNSPNIIRAVEAAAKSRVKTGKLKKLADSVIEVRYDDFGICESVHMLLAHLIATSIKNELDRKDCA
jgi:D-sedoheptulose 7-phosphate isomerase